MKPNAFYAFVFIVVCIGTVLGYGLSSLPHLVSFKLLNIFGILYGLLGIAVLAEFVVKNDRLKRFIVYRLAGVVLWSSTILPFGVLLGSGIAHMRNEPSAGVAAAAAVSFFCWSILPLGFLDAKVWNPASGKVPDLHGRTQIFGLWLLVCGAVAQLFAAIWDMLS
jgi:hypothetical protein